MTENTLPPSRAILALQARYKASGPEKLQELNSLIDIYRDGYKTQQEAQQSLREALHKLAGSAGMYEYYPLHDAARQALELVEDGLGAEASGLEDKQELAFQRVIEELRKL